MTKRCVALMTAAAFLAGCSQYPAAVDHQRPSTSSSALAHTNTTRGQLLLTEVQRQLAATKSSRYQHTTEVNETAGTYFYDCSGMIDYAAGRAVPSDAKALPTSTSARPLAGDIEHYLREGMQRPVDGWTAVDRTDALRPGDVIAWLVTEDSTSSDTGHVMLVLSAPTPNPARPGEWLVTVADSTLSPHASDTRHKPRTGLGSGTIGLIAEQGGAPTAFYWRGGQSSDAKQTEIALGRPA